MKELMAGGALGELYYFDSVRINLGLFQKDVNVLWDLAPHDIAILDHLVEEAPVSVCANGVCHTGNGIENVAYLTVYFQSGLIAHFHNNWLAPVKIRTVLVGGSKKMILYDDMEASEKVKVYDRGIDTMGTEGVHQALVSYRLGDMWAPRLETTEALRLVAAEFIDSMRLAAITGSIAQRSSLSAAVMNTASRLPKPSHSPLRKSSAAIASTPALLTSSP